MVAYVPGLTETDLKKVILSLQQLAAGRSNAGGTVTCSTGATTVVTDGNVGAGTRIQLTASSSNAAAAVTSTWISSVAVGTFTASHTVASTTDRTFVYNVQG